MTHDPSDNDMLVCVDALDREIGSAPKLACHSGGGILHRAFSAFLWRDGDGGPELLLQRRAAGKYHSGGLWTNACCSHPRLGEEIAGAVGRRLFEELGVREVRCTEVGSFVYRCMFDNGLAEYEYDHVFLGRYDGEVRPNPDEADACRWTGLGEVLDDLRLHPERYTAWFVTAAPLVARHLSGVRD